jgi:hypothetical protein
MPDPTLVDAADLIQWSERLDAQGRLPEIVRRLILASGTRLRKVEMRANEGIHLQGWDGIVVTDPESVHPFVPAGVSAWEMSTATDVEGKVNEDHAKRTNDPRGVDRQRSVYVAVSSRRWAAKKGWAEARSEERVWREVRAYDVDDLVAWLASAPAVHLWTSTIAGKDPDGMRGLEAEWENWSGVTQPQLSRELVLAGRDDAANRIQQWLRDPASTLVVRGDSPDEAIAVLVASALDLTGDERDLALARGIVVSSRGVWDQLVRTQRQLVLVMSGELLNAAPPQLARHHVYIPLGREASRTTATIELPRVRREQAREALIRMGVPEERAKNLAAAARRSLLSLRRQLSIYPDGLRPTWAGPEHLPRLLPAVLAGTWDERFAGDISVLESISGQQYDDLSRELQAWLHRSDPPFRRVGATWILSSKEDAWPLMIPAVRPMDLRRFEAAAHLVLTTADPALSLPNEKRWMARALDKGRPHSSELRTGLADTLALMGARGDLASFTDGGRSSDVSERVVRQIMATLAGDPTGGLWISVADVLPQLAEAAPIAFLDSLESDLRSSTPLCLSLFDEANEKSFPFAQPAHPGLLRALELLAWSTDHLSRAARALARLAHRDPGGKLLNRPNRSLREVFLPWHPQTAAPLSQRLVVLDTLRKDEPAVVWSLMLALLPRLMDSADYTQAPAWREWKPETETNISDAELDQAVKELIVRLLADIGNDANRWRDVILRIEDLPADIRERIIGALRAVELGADDSVGRAAIWNALREVAQRHRFSPDANWVLPESDIAEIESAMDRFVPADPAIRRAWLFSSGQTLLGFIGDNLESREKGLMRARQEAVTEILLFGGEEHLCAAARAVESPEELGRAAASEPQVAGFQRRWLCEMQANVDPAMQRFVGGYIFESFRIKGWPWAEPILNGDARKWSPATQASFLLYLASGTQVWDWVEQLGPETLRSYWTRVNPIVSTAQGEAGRVIRTLLECDRPYSAVWVAAYRREDEPRETFEVLVLQSLEMAARTTPPDGLDAGMFTFHVCELLDYLEKSKTIGPDQLARLEWSYIPWLVFERRRPTALHRLLSDSPSFFVEVVCAVFPDQSSVTTIVEESARAIATRGYELLKAWKRCPGINDDGTFDPQVLIFWVNEARQQLGAQNRLQYGDFQIGHILRHAPSGEDGVWPHAIVRDLIESVVSADLEGGLEHEIVVSRGVVARGILDGGGQERAVAQSYASAAESFRDAWPRVAALCQRIADKYVRDARRIDLEAEKREDLYS